MSDEREARALERHAQTGLTVLVVGLLGWVGLTTQETQIKIAQITTELAQIKAHIEEPRLRVEDVVRRVERLEDLTIEKLEKEARANERKRND